MDITVSKRVVRVQKTYRTIEMSSGTFLGIVPSILAIATENRPDLADIISIEMILRHGPTFVFEELETSDYEVWSLGEGGLLMSGLDSGFIRRSNSDNEIYEKHFFGSVRSIGRWVSISLPYESDIWDLVTRARDRTIAVQ